MSKEYKNLVGKRFGKLTAIKICGKNKSGNTLWLCKCDCGNETIVAISNLTTKHTVSCGCERYNYNKTHNMSYKNIYKVWHHIKSRCYNIKNKNYKNYGGRGIKMCDEWKDDFITFYNWAIANGYKEEKLPNGYNRLTIDRIDVNGNYEPSNCRWITMQEQQNNKRSNIKYCINGEYLNISQIARLYNMRVGLLYNRLTHGWGLEESVSTPIVDRKNRWRYANTKRL